MPQSYFQSLPSMKAYTINIKMVQLNNNLSSTKYKISFYFSILSND